MLEISLAVVGFGKSKTRQSRRQHVHAQISAKSASDEFVKRE
jgi:hypothetical protein